MSCHTHLPKKTLSKYIGNTLFKFEYRIGIRLAVAHNEWLQICTIAYAVKINEERKQILYIVWQ